MKKLILIGLLLSIGFASFVQAQTEEIGCGYEANTDFLAICNNPTSIFNKRITFLSQFSLEEVCTFQKLTETNGEFAVKKAINKQEANGTLLNVQRQIPIVAHIVRKTDQTGGTTNAAIEQALATVNAVYNDFNMHFFLYKTKFIDSDGIFNTHFDTTVIDYDVLNVKTRNIKRKLNMYFVPSASTSWAYSPALNENYQHILIKNAHISNGSTMGHEIGHWFNLLHTHGPSNKKRTTELVDGSNCETDGDYVCDTPADPNLLGKVDTNCRYIDATGAVDFAGNSFNPDPKNIMSYARKSCREHFSNGQKYRIQAAYLGMDAERGYTFSSTASSNLDVAYTVPWIPQSSNINCWDASISMIIAWRDSYNYSPALDAQAGAYWEQYYGDCHSSQPGLPTYDASTFEGFGMTTKLPMSRTPQNIAELLEDYGPLWVAASTCAQANQNCTGSKVVTGIVGDGTPSGTVLMINDPNSTTAEGRTYRLIFTEFQEQIEQLQINNLENDFLNSFYIAHVQI